MNRGIETPHASEGPQRRTASPSILPREDAILRQSFEHDKDSNRGNKKSDETKRRPHQMLSFRADEMNLVTRAEV